MMKIGQPTDNSVPVSPPPASVPAKAASAANPPRTASNSAQKAGVAVTVSTLARTLGASKASESADVDMEKVNATRSAIEQGTYVVNPEVIADKLLANAQEMLNRTRS